MDQQKDKDGIITYFLGTISLVDTLPANSIFGFYIQFKNKFPVFFLFGSFDLNRPFAILSESPTSWLGWQDQVV